MAVEEWDSHIEVATINLFSICGYRKSYNKADTCSLAFSKLLSTSHCPPNLKGNII
jgi:hypothetical protein